MATKLVLICNNKLGFQMAGRGCGVVLGNAWAWLVWPGYINSDRVASCCNVHWKNKLSFLEMIGHFLHLACFPREVQSRVVCTRIDNDGTVIKCAKGRECRTVAVSMA